MAQRSKIDSNETGLRYAEEESPGVLPTTPDWIPLEPNSYGEFGAEITTVARNPINPSRQRKKGVVTDLDASGNFNNDFTQTNLQDLLQGFFFADLRRKGEETVTAVDGTAETYAMADTSGFLVDSIALASGFGEAANNGIRDITAVTASTSVTVAQDVVDEPSPPADAKMVVVGHTGASGDINVDAAGDLPAYTSTALDFTTLGLIEGEWIFVGGDGAGTSFVNTENNGFKRVRSIEANRLEIDKSDQTMTTETGTGLTIKFYFGRVLKNELDDLIVKRTYQLERTLGAPDDAQPTEIQAEYLVGSVPGEFTLNIPTADKLNADLSFLSEDDQTIDGPTPLKTGNRPDIVESDAFNTSSDFSRIKMAEVVDGDEAPNALFTFIEEMTLVINNNLQANKALGVLGSCGISAGTFQVSGSLTAYFANVSSIDAVRNNANITLDVMIVKSNAGVGIDLPLLTLGDGRPDVEQDQPIKLPLNMDAATAALIDPNLDYTTLLVFWDYLPDAADT